MIYDFVECLLVVVLNNVIVLCYYQINHTMIYDHTTTTK
jgi:hypothetical protein